MSVKDDIIKIIPPAFIRDGNMKETIHSNGHSCGYCHGNGFFLGEQLREYVKKNCPVCNGSGKLDAVINRVETIKKIIKMRKPTFQQVIRIIVAMPFALIAFVLIFSGILLKAAGRMCVLDFSAARYEIEQINSI